jgi:hypothetical protein
MTKLELSTEELFMLKDLLEGDMERTPWCEVEYDDVGLMQYYLDRATVLVKVREELGA